MPQKKNYSRLSPERRAALIQKNIIQRRVARAFSQDHTVASHGTEKKSRTDLGLAILSAVDEETGKPVTQPGQCRSKEEIAIYCGCTDGAIHAIEKIALRKIRNALMFRHPELREAFLDFLFYNRSAAKRTGARGGGIMKDNAQKPFEFDWIFKFAGKEVCMRCMLISHEAMKTNPGESFSTAWVGKFHVASFN